MYLTLQCNAITVHTPSKGTKKHKTMKKFIPCFTVIILLLSLSFGHTLLADSRIRLQVGYLPILDHLPLLVSHAKDNCAFEEVEIKPKLFKAWGEMVGALKAGIIDAAFILSPLAMDLFNQGVDIKTVLLAHRDGSAIIIKRDSTIWRLTSRTYSIFRLGSIQKNKHKGQP